MAYFKCNQASGGGGGGQMVETVLWTNSNPSASSGFAAQAVTLSDDIDNYDYICVEYARGYNYLTTKAKVFCSVSDFKTFGYSAGKQSLALGMYGNAAQFRAFYYDSDTQAHFGPNLQAGSAVNANNIPLYIYGCKIE